MDKSLLSPATLVGGSLAGALLIAAWFGALSNETEPVRDPPQRVAQAPQPRNEPPPMAAQLAPPTVAAPLAAPTAASAAAAEPVALSATCPAQALASARGAHDGRFALDAALASGTRIEPAAYLQVAREATQEGRTRDAEVALLAACHLAEKASGSHSVPLADLKSQMAQHYLGLAASEPAGGGRDRLLERAATLLSESAVTYAAALGRDASKTRLAEQRLASVRDPATLQLARAGRSDTPSTQVLGAAAQSHEAQSKEAQSHEARGTEARGGCSGSAARRLVCSDPELAQLDRDMERLHAQASSVSRDRPGLQQRDSQALARRDAACQDKACLLRWYAQRRSQLLDEF